MNRRLSVVLLVVLLMTALMPAASAFAQPDEPTTLTAQAFFDTQQSTIRPGDPCVRTRVQITAEVNYAAGDPPARQVLLRITEFDDCVVDDFGLVAEWFTIAQLDPADEALRINPRLNNARLQQTLTACNLVDSSDCRTLKLNVHWRGVGAAEQDGGTTNREAIAWGRVFDVTHSLNLAPDRAVFALLSRFDAP